MTQRTLWSAITRPRSLRKIISQRSDSEINRQAVAAESAIVWGGCLTRPRFFARNEKFRPAVWRALSPNFVAAPVLGAWWRRRTRCGGLGRRRRCGAGWIRCSRSCAARSRSGSRGARRCTARSRRTGRGGFRCWAGRCCFRRWTGRSRFRSRARRSCFRCWTGRSRRSWGRRGRPRSRIRGSRLRRSGSRS